MKKDTLVRMTTGSPAKLILRFTWPLLLGNLMQQLYNIVDSIVVGQFVGHTALAAVGTTFPVVFLMISLYRAWYRCYSYYFAILWGRGSKECQTNDRHDLSDHAGCGHPVNRHRYLAGPAAADPHRYAGRCFAASHDLHANHLCRLDRFLWF